MRKLGAVVGILGCIMDRIRDQLPMRNAIASQLVRHDLPGFPTMRVEQTSEQALSGLAVATTLQEFINDFSILIDSAPLIFMNTSSMKNVFPFPWCFIFKRRAYFDSTLLRHSRIFS